MSRALDHKDRVWLGVLGIGSQRVSVLGCLGHWVTRTKCGWVSSASGHKEGVWQGV